MTPRTGTDSLRLPLAGPVAWAAHFLLCYASVAIDCARPSVDGTGRVLVGVYTLVALALLGVVFRIAWPSRADPDPQRRFVAALTIGLAAVSAAATIVVAFPALVLESCR